MDMDVHSDQAIRLEVVDTGRRRRFTEAEKLRIVEESLLGHRQASRTARRHGIPNSLLFRWRKAYREGRLATGGAAFVPAMVVADRPTEVTASAGDGDGRMEIVVCGDRRVIVGRDVDPAALARVLEVLEGRPACPKPKGEGR